MHIKGARPFIIPARQLVIQFNGRTACVLKLFIVNNEIFFKKFEFFFFDFLKIQRGDPLDKKKIGKIFKFFEKNFINKKCAYGPKMKPRQVLGQYLEVYG